VSWADQAQCKGDPNPGRWFLNSTNHQNLLDLQDICALCPVRNGCGQAAMDEEAKIGSGGRWGFRAYMTSQQREAIARLGGLRGRDPMKVVLGQTTATKKGKKIVHGHAPPIPENGIEWKRTHTALARKLTRYIELNVKPGRNLPGVVKLCKDLGCTEDRLRTVLDALLQSGTIIEHEPSRYVRTTN